MSLKYTYKNKCNVYYIITVLQGSYLKVKKSTRADLKAKAIYWKQNSRYGICKWGTQRMPTDVLKHISSLRKIE